MSDMQEQSDLPGTPGTPEGETGASESDPVVPSVEGREVDEEAMDEGGS